MTPESSDAAGVLLAGADVAGLEALRPAAEMLASFGIRVEMMVVPPGEPAAAPGGDLCAVIAASADATLPAALAAQTLLPVIRVPSPTGDTRGLALLNDGADNLPAGPADGVFATMAIGEAGAKNAALFVISLLAGRDERLRAAWANFRARQTDAVLQRPPLTFEE